MFLTAQVFLRGCTSRDDVVVDIDRERLVQRMEQYFEPTISHEQMRRIAPSAMMDTTQFHAEATRDYLRKRGFLPQNIIRYSYRPFDVRWLYWEPETKLLDRNRADYFPHVFDGNIWLGAAQRHRKDFDPPLVSSRLCSLHIIERGANFFPLWMRPIHQGSLFSGWADNPSNVDNLQLNVSQATRHYLTTVGTLDDAENLFYHTLAILHAPMYRTENADALRQDWPRVLLPNSKEVLLASAKLGRQVAGLLDTENPVVGVTSGKIRSELKAIAVISRAGGGQLNPDAGDLAITAGWGHAGQSGVTMPGKGKIIERPYTLEERAAIKEGAAALSLSAEQAIEQLGETTCDIYLNDVAYWKNVQALVWKYTIGGYQVIKKWLSYRERDLLGRSLTKEEIREVTNMARRIAAILIMEPALDANYEVVNQSSYDWPK